MGARRNSNPHKILTYLLVGGGVLIISTLAPSAGAQIVRQLLVGYIRKKRFQRYRFLNDLKSLQKRELVSYNENEKGEVQINITRKGEKVMLKYKLDEMQLKKPVRWDGKWRLVMFDIPHAHKRARDTLRQKLTDLNFHQLQKSVFITPYPCEDEIDFIASLFDIRKNTLLLYVGSFEGEQKLRHQFNI